MMGSRIVTANGYDLQKQLLAMPITIKERFSLDRFKLGEKSATQPVTLSHRRIFILPTAKGLVLTLIIMAMLIASTIYGNNLGFILTFLVAGIAIVSIIHSFRELAGLKFTSQAGQPVFCGESALVICYLDNASQFVRNSLWLGTKNGSRSCCNLEAQQSRKISLNLQTSIRGWHPIGTITVECYFPLGIFRAWSPIMADEKILVYPTPAANSLPFPRSFQSPLESQQKKSGDNDFKGFQHYQPGDSLRQINWKALAKEHGLYTKQYEDDETAVVWLDWGYTPGQSVEQRLSRLCRWIIDAEQSNVRYGLKLPLLKIEPASGEPHRSNCLKALALFGEKQ